MLRDFCLAFINSVLIGVLISLVSVSDNSYLPSLLELVRNLGLSYSPAVLIRHGLLSLFPRGKALYGWLFVPIVGSAFYASAITWHSVKQELTFERSLGWVCMQGVGLFVASAGVLTFLSLPISAWFHRHRPVVPDVTKGVAVTNND